MDKPRPPRNTDSRSRIDPLASGDAAKTFHPLERLETPNRGTDSRTEGRDIQKPRKITVIEVRELGKLPLPAEGVTTRDGGNSTTLTDRNGNRRIFYFFGDTGLYNDEWTQTQGSPWKLRTNTAAIARLDTPLTLTEPLDRHGYPPNFVTYTPEEARFNNELQELHREKVPPTDIDERFKQNGELLNRIAIWPGSPISDGKYGGYAFCNMILTQSDFRFYRAGVTLARIHISGDRFNMTRQQGLLFQPSEPAFSFAMIDKDHQTVYLYGQMPARMIAPSPHVLARVQLEQVPNRNAYEFWNGASWTKDITRVAPVMDGLSEAVSVSYNQHLNGYLAVYSKPMDNHIFASTAPLPEGPWSEPKALFQGKAPVTVGHTGDAGMGFNYAGIEHPGLASENGKKIVVGYYNAIGAGYGQLEMAQLTLD